MVGEDHTVLSLQVSRHFRCYVVCGQGGVEPPTFRLSG
jgi:hypothetical protein